jgi:hypothetical protein
MPDDGDGVSDHGWRSDRMPSGGDQVPAGGYNVSSGTHKMHGRR